MALKFPGQTLMLMMEPDGTDSSPYHLAIVRDGGKDTYYLDGIPKTLYEVKRLDRAMSEGEIIEEIERLKALGYSI